MNHLTERLERDKYGRRVRHIARDTAPFNTLVVIVTLPKAYREAHPDQGYLVNDWQVDHSFDGHEADVARGKITYTRTLAQARELAVSKIA